MSIHQSMWKMCKIIQSGTVSDFNKRVIKWEGLHSGEVTVMAALQLWRVNVGGVTSLLHEAQKLEQLGFSVTQEILWDAIIIMIM